MSAVLIYILASLAFIMSVVLLSFIPSKTARSVILFAYLLLFIGAMTYLLYRVSGQREFTDLFQVFSNLSGG